MILPLPAALWPTLLLLLNILTPSVYSAAGDSCSTSSQCGSDAPCCGLGNTCGSGAMSCAGYCQPMSSYKPTSCLPNPICQNTNITFKPENYNDPSVFRPILQYNGNPSLAPFTLDSGSLGKGTEGVLGQLTIDRQVKISTTRYVLYGDIEARVRSNVTNGIVLAFISMSDTKDEIDWEFTTSDVASGKTNYFWQGISATGNGTDVQENSLDRREWNTYGLNWQPNMLQWKINGKVVRTLRKSAAGTNGQYFPRSPSRIQLSLWAAGNSSAEPSGQVDWAGGLVDWSSSYYKSTGYYAMELGSFSVSCADPNAQSLATTGTGSNITSWVYTGTNDSTTGNEPGFQLNKDSITYLKNPAAGGVYGTPGYEDQTASTKNNNNMWDGSGDTGANDSAANGSSSSGGGISAASAKKYGIPIAAGVVGLIILWGLIVWCVRKRRNNRSAIAGVQGGGVDATGTKFNSKMPTGVTRRTSLVPTAGGISGGKYTKLNDPASHNDSDFDLPMGAEKQGQGVGPASGPRPGSKMAHEAYAMTPQVAGNNWNRVNTPVVPQYRQGAGSQVGWGAGGGYSHSGAGGGYGNAAPGVHYTQQQQNYGAGGRGYTAQYPSQQQQYAQQQPAWAQSQHQQYGSGHAPSPYYHGSQQGSYGTPRYYS